MIDDSPLRRPRPELLPPPPAWDMILAELPEDGRDQAKAHKILTIRRPPTGAKLTSVDQVLRLILSYVGLDSSLKTTAASAAAGGEMPAISSVSLPQWMKKAGPWIGGIVATMTTADLLFVMLVTTVERATLSWADLLRLYRLRWQVERIIKQDKSLGGLGKLPNFLPETISCWLNAKMLLATVARQRVVRASEPAFPP